MQETKLDTEAAAPAEKGGLLSDITKAGSGALAMAAVVGSLMLSGTVRVGEEPIADRPGVETRIASDSSMIEMKIAMATSDVRAPLEQQELRQKYQELETVQVDVVDDSGKTVKRDQLRGVVDGQGKPVLRDTVIYRHPRLSEVLKCEARAGQVYQAIYMLDSVVVGTMQYQIPELPDGKVCRWNPTNDFVTDLQSR